MPEPVPDATVVRDLLARERRDDTPALRVDAQDRTRSYRDLCNTAYKVGNILSHYGVRSGDRVAVDPLAHPEPVLTFLGASLLGATVQFEAEPGTDARAVVVHADREEAFDLQPGSHLLAFGDVPERPETAHWEAEVWSENPVFPPTGRDPDDSVLVAENETYSNRDFLTAARAVVDSLDLDGDSRVAVRASLADPRTVAAGIIAPLLVGGVVHLPGDGEESSATVSVTDDGHSSTDIDGAVLNVADVRL